MSTLTITLAGGIIRIFILIIVALIIYKIFKEAGNNEYLDNDPNL